MKVIIVTADGTVETREIENSLESVQKIVGGYVQQIGMDNLIVLMNEEGKLDGLPVNTKASGVVHYGGAFGLSPDDMLVGTIIFCSMKGEEWSSIEPQYEERVQKLLAS